MPRNTMSSFALAGSTARPQIIAMRIRRIVFLPTGPRSHHACFLRKLLQNLPQRTGTGHPLWKRQAQRRAVELQLEAFGIAPDATPGAVGRVEQLGGIKPHRLGVIV